jgi:Spy/CpxP family protein refolding chaperone
LRALNLTDAQEQQIRSIREQEQETVRQLDEQLRQAGRAQRVAIETLPVNEGLIRQTTAALAEVQADAAVQQALVHSRIWAVLTPAQQAEATKLRAERDAREQAQRQAAAAKRQNRQQ